MHQLATSPALDYTHLPSSLAVRRPLSMLDALLGTAHSTLTRLVISYHRATGSPRPIVLPLTWHEHRLMRLFVLGASVPLIAAAQTTSTAAIEAQLDGIVTTLGCSNQDQTREVYECRGPIEPSVFDMLGREQHALLESLLAGDLSELDLVQPRRGRCPPPTPTVIKMFCVLGVTTTTELIALTHASTVTPLDTG